MPNLALLALEASDGTVVLTSITLVFVLNLKANRYGSIISKRIP